MIANEQHDAESALQARLPLYVDVDGTLIKTDLLVESILLLLKRSALYVFFLPLWLLRGRAELKSRIADRVVIDPDLLPYDDELLSYLRGEADRGRPIYLASASDQRFVDAIAAHLGFVSGALASNHGVNLKGAAKAQAILQHADGTSFAYAGNDRADVDVWRVAKEAIVVGGNAVIERSARQVSSVVRVVDRKRADLKTFLRLIRIHQWLKNLLIFLPLFAADRIGDKQGVLAASLTFLVFGLCASGNYIINDLFDLQSDRKHPSKSLRPVAAGLVSPATAIWISALLLFGAFAIALVVVPRAVPSLVLYQGLTLAYSLHLKRLVLIDVLTLACLYTLRVFAGAAAISVVPSAWLLGFSVFIFFSLSLVKRCSELKRMEHLNRIEAHGRDYRVSDLPLLQALGVASGQASVLVVALYIDSSVAATQYRAPQALWLVCLLLLYWICRMWLKTARGEMHDDPIVYSATDLASAVTFAAIVAVWIAAHLPA